MVNRGIIALDADGVLLDYGLAYASAWQRAFGEYPRERDPAAYWAMDRWEVRQVEGAELDRFVAAFDEEFWAALPPLPGAVEACHALARAGYELVCVTALPDRFARARRDNLLAHGFPIEVVHTAEHDPGHVSPKAEVLHRLQPLAFVDDYLPFFRGLDAGMHRALVLREPNGSPNTQEALLHWTDSRHADLAAFARWWLAREE